MLLLTVSIGAFAQQSTLRATLNKPLVIGTSFFSNDGEVFFDESFGFIFPLIFMVIIYTALILTFHYQVTKYLLFLERIIVPVDDVNSSVSWIKRY